MFTNLPPRVERYALKKLYTNSAEHVGDLFTATVKNSGQGRKVGADRDEALPGRFLAIRASAVWPQVLTEQIRGPPLQKGQTKLSYLITTSAAIKCVRPYF